VSNQKNGWAFFVGDNNVPGTMIKKSINNRKELYKIMT